MIVAMVTNNFLPHISGVGTSITRLTRGLRRRGHTVHIFAPWAPGYRDPDRSIHRVISLPLPEPFIPLPLPSLWAFRRGLERLQPDLIHIHHPFLLGPAALRIGRRMHRPVVFTYHAVYEAYVHYVPLLPKSWIAERVKAWTLHIAKQVDAVVAPSASIAEMLRDRGLTAPIHTIPTGIDVRLFREPSGTREATRSQWKIPAEAPVILSLGRLAKEKGFEDVLRAFVSIRKTRKDAYLVIGGDGPARSSLENVAHDLGLGEYARFVGAVPHEEVPSFLAGGDIFAYASVSETQGLVTLEAHAAGLPAVVVDAPGNRDIVIHNESGLVTTPSPSALADGIERLLKNQELRKRFAAAARVRAEAFSEDRMAEQMETLYRSLLS